MIWRKNKYAYFYRLRSIASEGYVFTGICLSNFGGRWHEMHHGIGHMVWWGHDLGEGWWPRGRGHPPFQTCHHPLSQTWSTPPPVRPVTTIPWSDLVTPPSQTWSSPPPPLPSGKQRTRQYGQCAGGTHPIAMHSYLLVYCLKVFFLLRENKVMVLK